MLGMKACEVDKIARDIITEYGYGEKYIHSTGHSLGLDIHESPNASIKDKTILEDNMIITIEPGIYLEGEFGVRIEDMILMVSREYILLDTWGKILLIKSKMPILLKGLKA